MRMILQAMQRWCGMAQTRRFMPTYQKLHRSVFGNSVVQSCRQQSSHVTTTKTSYFVAKPIHISLCQKHRQLFTSIKSLINKPYNVTRNLRVDTLVFAHKNESFFKILSYFGIFQLAMWTYLSLFAFQQLKTVPVLVQDVSELPWYKKLLYKQGQYKNALSLLSFVVGGVVFFITITYPQRVVKSLWLLKGGQQVRISTYSWMGKTRTFTSPVDQISCTEARTGKGPHIPMKVGDKKFFFIIDKQGSFPKPDLFDYVICLQRKL